MTFPILLFSSFVLVAVLTLRSGSTTRSPPRRPTAVGMVLRTPALLVPAAMSAVAIWIATVADFAAPAGPGPGRLPATAAWILVQGCILAGFVGLMQAAHQARTPNGVHFWRGIRSHFFTFAIANALALLGWLAVRELVGAETGLFAVLYLAPSLVLAPVFGTAARYPGRPFRALHATFERVRWDLAHTSWLLTQQAVILAALYVLCRSHGTPDFNFHGLAARSSVLGFNAEPFLPALDGGPHGTWATLGFTAAAMVTSSVYMVRYYRRVIDAPVQR